MMPQNPGDPAVLERMIEECRAGAPLGCYIDESVPPTGSVLWEPTKDTPWIVAIHPDALPDWLTLFPHMHRCWMVEGSAAEVVQTLRESGANAMTIDEAKEAGL